LLLERLDGADAEVRKFIVDILGEIACPDCVAALLPYLQDEDENVRYAVVETLGKLGSVEAVGGLLKLLENADAGLQFSIFEALTAIGEGVPAAQILPYAERPLLRKSVFGCLGRLSDPAGIPLLLNGLSDPLRKNRDVALTALGQLIRSLAVHDCPEVEPQTDQVVGLLYDYLKHEKQEFRRAACFVLSLFPNAEVIHRILPLLAEEELRADVVAAAQLIPKALFDSLVASTCLADEHALFLIYLLGELGYAEIESLAIAAVDAEDPQFRYAAIMTLGKIGSTQAIMKIGDALADEIEEIRDAASMALCEIGKVELTAMVKTVSPYLESPQAELRLLAVKTLGGMPTDRVESHLLLALKDVAPEVRCEALRGLAGHQSQRLLSGLSLALTDEVADVRRLAAAAIGAFPARNSLPLLQHALEDSDPWVRMEAVRALSPGDDPSIEQILQAGLADSVGLVAIATLETVKRVLPEKAERMLNSALEHEDQEVVSTAVRLFCSSESCIELLRHDRPLVRLQAVRAIQQTADRCCVSVLEEQLEEETDGQVRQAIEEVLRKGLARS
jgi:HEAT repeat protein